MMYEVEVRVPEGQLTCKCEQRRVHGMKSSLRSHPGRYSMFMDCNEVSPTQHHVMECVRGSWTQKYFKSSFHLPESLAAGVGPEGSFSQWTVNGNFGCSFRTEAVRASVPSSSFSPLPQDLAGHMLQMMQLTHSRLYVSEKYIVTA